MLTTNSFPILSFASALIGKIISEKKPKQCNNSFSIRLENANRHEDHDIFNQAKNGQRRYCIRPKKIQTSKTSIHSFDSYGIPTYTYACSSTPTIIILMKHELVHIYIWTHLDICSRIDSHKWKNSCVARTTCMPTCTINACSTGANIQIVMKHEHVHINMCTCLDIHSRIVKPQVIECQTYNEIPETQKKLLCLLNVVEQTNGALLTKSLIQALEGLCFKAFRLDPWLTLFRLSTQLGLLVMKA
ncbi:hypothetical protein KP509_30G044700 [Ceratopteris richardii]|uniref:Uncharacterized protein n=1 Tax=Ceratopteris richardii TaxID=49495 RepID=A0A8T2R4B2_CERRI|nr:hypothetical protein KP509_30G044700 [Ceratopteris richardii]